MSDKIIGMLLGVMLTVVILSSLGLVMAHGNDDVPENYNEGITGYHMNMGSGMMMHNGVSHNENDSHDTIEHMGGCPMMKDFKWHDSVTIEEMDQDDDGLCDICGMPVENCLDMAESGGMMNCHMMM